MIFYPPRVRKKPLKQTWQVNSRESTCAGLAISFVTSNTATDVRSFGVSTHSVGVAFITTQTVAVIEMCK